MIIGPICVGKTSVAAELSALLGVRHVSLDELAPQYLSQSAWYDPDRGEELEREDGYVAKYRYREPVFPWLLGQLFAEHGDCVFDLGAGHTCLLDPSLVADVAAQLASFSNVILLLPSPDRTRSLAVIRDRLRADPERDGDVWEYDDIDFLSHWVTSGQNERLATHVVFTEERRPPEVAAEIRMLLVTGTTPTTPSSQWSVG